MPKARPKAHPDHMTIAHAAEALGKSRSFVRRAVAAGKLRSTSEPFKSNLNPSGSANLVLVLSQDVRDAIAGKIDLSSLDAVKVPARKPAPEGLEEFGERFVNLEQSIEQLAIMVATVLERMDAAPATKRPARKGEVPDV